MPPQSRSLFFPIAIILSVFAILYIFAKIFGPIPLNITSVTTSKTDMFTVSGEGEASAVPDSAEFTLGVTETATTVEEAQTQVNETSTAIINALKQAGVKENDIQTANYNVTPNYDFNAPNQEITGYTVSQNLQVTVSPIENANRAIDAGTQNGANMVGNVTFVLNDDKKAELESTARKQAIDAAKQKAQSIAQAAGIKLGRIINVQENMSQAPGPFFAERSAVALDAREESAPTELQAGENTVSLTVTLFYETL